MGWLKTWFVIESNDNYFAACINKVIHSKRIGTTADADLIEYPKTIQKVIVRFPDAQIVIPEHGSFAGKEILTHTLELFDE